MSNLSRKLALVLITGLVGVVSGYTSVGRTEGCGDLPRPVAAEATTPSVSDFWTPGRLRGAQPTELPYASESALERKETDFGIAPVTDGASNTPVQGMNTNRSR